MRKPCGGLALPSTLPSALLLALLTLTGLLTGGPGAVQAQTLSCNLSNVASNWAINFGTYSGNALSITSPSPLQIECANPTNTARAIHLCVGLGVGTGGISVNDRRMKNNSHTLLYQLYRDNAHTQVFRPVLTSSSIHYSAIVNANTMTTLNTNIYLYGQLFGNQTPGTTGIYLSDFNPAHLEIKWGDYPTTQAPSLCSALTQTMGGNFSVQAQVQNLCTVNVLAHINFSSFTPSSNTEKTTAGRIRVQCTGVPSSSYKVEMRDGLYAQNNGNATAVRRMRHATQTNQYVSYDLYRNPQYTQRWGRISNNQHLSGNCSNTNGCAHNIYARTKVVGSNVAQGNYADMVEVVVEY